MTKNAEILYDSSLNGDVVILFEHFKKILSTTNIQVDGNTSESIELKFNVHFREILKAW